MNLNHNMHLVPQIVQDLVEGTFNETKHENDRNDENDENGEHAETEKSNQIMRMQKT